METLRLLNALVFSEDLGGFTPVKRVKTALDGGVYCLIVQSVVHFSTSEVLYDWLLKFLLDLATYAVYPEVFPFLEAALSHVPSEAPYQDETFGEWWALIRQSVSDRRLMDEGGVRMPLADATMCHCIHVSPNHTLISQM
jgi:hypothetical protein